MSCLCQKPCNHFKTDQLQGFSGDSFSLTDALTDPDKVIDQYKADAYKIVLTLAGALVLGNYLMLHQVLNQKIKKVRRAT